MAVIREFLGADQLAAPAPEPTSPTSPSLDPSGSKDREADNTACNAPGPRDEGEGVTSMKRTHAIRALLSICSALTAIFMVGGANAKW